MTPIEASEQLLRIQASSYPNFSEKDQRKVKKELLKLADPSLEEDSKKPEVTTRELGLILAAGNNG